MKTQHEVETEDRMNGRIVEARREGKTEKNGKTEGRKNFWVAHICIF